MNVLLKEKHYIELGNVKVLAISSEFNDDFIKKNLNLVKTIAYDALLKLCRNDGIAILIQETELGHVMRVCLIRRDISFVNIIKSIPSDITDKLNITLRGNHILIRFRDPSESSLDQMLKIASHIASATIA